MGIGLNSLLIESKDLTTIMDNIIENTSFTNSTIGFLTEINRDFRDADKQMYKSIYEADSLVAVNESFSDFFIKVKEIIKKFLKYIKSLFDRFITTLHRIVNSEKYLLKKEDAIKKFNSDHEFDFDGYIFTIEPNIPICNALVEFNSNFVNLDLSELGSNQNTNKEKLKNQYDNLKKDIEGDKYDKLRGEVIGRPGAMIYQSEFSNELFELFRDGSDSTSIFTVTSTVVTECFRDMKNYKEVEKETKKKKKEIENQYKEIEKQIDRMISTERTSGGYEVDLSNIPTAAGKGNSSTKVTLNNDAMNQLNLYVKLLTNQISEMTTIHSIAFSHKLDALKDKYTQDKRILYIALSKVEKDKEFRGEI